MLYVNTIYSIYDFYGSCLHTCFLMYIYIFIVAFYRLNKLVLVVVSSILVNTAFRVLYFSFYYLIHLEYIL